MTEITMRAYICKFCNMKVYTAVEMGLHSAKHTNKLELPHKALSNFIIEEIEE